MRDEGRIADLGLILAAGGSGRRYGGRNKLLEELDHVPVFIHALRRLAPLGAVTVLVVPAADLPLFAAAAAQYCPDLPVSCVPGGSTRSHSVFQGLTVLPPEVKYVAVHDAARPLASPDLLRRCVAGARQYGGALAAHPVTDTLKKAAADATVAGTVDRDGLWAVETPQVFSRSELQQAYETALAAGHDFTDDAGVMEAAGKRVVLIHNSEPNVKITFPADRQLAAALLRSRQPR
ncbi:MAG: 2-C-methyl-D-erythritol 4-phosphate cytidylyltransferase [Victivallales bacterium]|nr:2-C-methyl-D-erythritol 4-phosphate cytidylyltransferase [Victivallales bacterium]